MYNTPADYHNNAERNAGGSYHHHPNQAAAAADGTAANHHNNGVDFANNKSMLQTGDIPNGNGYTSSARAASMSVHQQQHAGTNAPPDVEESDFDFLGPLGRGASSVVVEARHIPSGMVFALKRISRMSIWRNPALNRRVRFEINVHRILRHPNVVRLHTYYVTPTELVLVLEHCERGTLHGKLKSTANGVFDEQRAARYTRQIVRGTAYLHNKGVLHRDLKLENILLDFEGRVKIADFGLAWQKEAAEDCHSPQRGSSMGSGSNSSMGSSGAGGGFFGTLDYLSPEIILKQDYSQKSDVWAVGVMLSEMIGGVAPFYQPSEKGSMAAIVHGQPTIPTWNRLSQACQHFLQLVLDKDPANRPTAEVLLQHPFLASFGGGGTSIECSM